MGWMGSRLKRYLKNRGTACECRPVVRIFLLTSIVLNLAGCASFGPPSVERDRFDYINAIGSSWQQQTLLNIVKLRYADTPVFLDVGQIISAYQLSGAVTIGASLNSTSAFGDILNLGSAGTFVDRPTITYTPLTGSHFIHVLMTPIPAPGLFRLIEQNSPVDLILQIAVQRINGISNSMGGARGRAADPDFARLLAALRRLQDSGVLGLRVEVSKETKEEGTMMTISKKNLPPEVQADRELVGKLLGLRPDLQVFKIVYGGVSDKDDVIAVQTRSGYQIMTQLGANAEAPAEHVAERRTYPPIPEPGGSAQALPPLIRIHAQKSRSTDAFAAVKYRDYWYWIDDRDLRSKQVFSYMIIMMSLAVKEDNAQKPVLTIQGN